MKVSERSFTFFEFFFSLTSLVKLEMIGHTRERYPFLTRVLIYEPVTFSLVCFGSREKDFPKKDN
jgi:hypothetical protein